MQYFFFGTPHFAEIILKTLIESGLPPVAVVTNPDRPVGRKKVITPPPAKIAAKEFGISVWQPESLKDDAANQDFFKKHPAEIGIVAAYGKIIPKGVIEMFPRGLVGVHPSLLPKHRGPTPIQTAILCGETETGVTLYALDSAVDHGPVLAQEKIRIDDADIYATMEEKLAKLGGRLLVSLLPKISRNKIKPEKQNESAATYTKKFGSEDGFVTPNLLDASLAGKDPFSARNIYNKIRALGEEPGVYTIQKGKRIKILEASIVGNFLKLKRIQIAGKKPQFL